MTTSAVIAWPRIPAEIGAMARAVLVLPVMLLLLQDFSGDLATNPSMRNAVRDGVQAGDVADTAITADIASADDAVITPGDLDAVYRGMVNTRRAVLDRLRASGPDFWTLSPRLRGEFMEDLLGMNLARNFPVIDGWDGVARKAISLKTLDLGDDFYRRADVLDFTVRKYIDDFDQWKSASGVTNYKARGQIANVDRAGNDVVIDLRDPSFVRSKELVLAVPAGPVYTPGHRALLGKLQAYAAGREPPISLTIIEIP